MKHLHTTVLIGIALMASTSKAAPVAVPLVAGLTIISSASERQGDYESTLTVEALDEDGMLHLFTSADVPTPAGGKATPVRVNRDVSAADRRDARTYKYMFYSNGADEYPGTTAMGVSAAVISSLRTTGKADITLDGQLGGLGGMLSSLLAMAPGNPTGDAPPGYLSAAGTIEAVETKPVAYPLIVNDSLVSLSAWHVKGRFVQDGTTVTVEWFLLDDPANALTLRAVFGKQDRLEVTRITFPLTDPVGTLETSLAHEHRAVLYGIYFDFNSATIKPLSDPTLQSIFEVMNKHPDWLLKIEGHTDNVGDDAQNQSLSARRANAVRIALEQRGIADRRLSTAGFGASTPRATNDTLAGRARNRRVELTRQ